MSKERQLRIADKIRNRLRSARVSELLKKWSELDVEIAAMDDSSQQQWLSHHNMMSRSNNLVEGDFTNVVSRLTLLGPTVIVIALGSRPDAEPALLIDPSALIQSEDRLRAIYPDGFVAWDENQAYGLEIDFSEQGFQACEKSPRYRT